MRAPVPDLSCSQPQILAEFSSSIANLCRLLMPKYYFLFFNYQKWRTTNSFEF